MVDVEVDNINSHGCTLLKLCIELECNPNPKVEFRLLIWKDGPMTTNFKPHYPSLLLVANLQQDMNEILFIIFQI